jgi:hypothetical protein
MNVSVAVITFRSFAEYSWNEQEIMTERKDFTFLHSVTAVLSPQYVLTEITGTT